MVSAAVTPSMAVMSMARPPITAARMWSPSSHRSRRASSAEVDVDGTELRSLLVGIGLVGHRPTADLGTGEVLQQARCSQWWMQLDVEWIVRVLAHGRLVHGQ